MKHTKMLARINKRCDSKKKLLWKNIAAKIVVICSSILIDISIAVVKITTSAKGSRRIAKVSAVLTQGCESQLDKAERLCEFVHKEIEYYRFSQWLIPEVVLRCGIGDCKNQAQLLQALMSSVGIQSDMTVGVIDKKAKCPQIHAWLNFRTNGEIWVTDPTIAGHPMTVDGYKKTINGFIDVTEEYRKTRQIIVCRS